MDATQRYLNNIRFDLVYKALLIISIGWAAYLYRINIGIQLFLLVLALATGTLFHFQRKNLQRILKWVNEKEQTFEEKLTFLQKESFRSLTNTAASNPVLLIVYFFIFSHYQFDGLPYIGLVDYFTYSAFAIFAFALSFFIGKGLINALKITVEIQEGLYKQEDINQQKKIIKRKQMMRLIGISILIFVLIVLYLSLN